MASDPRHFLRRSGPILLSLALLAVPAVAEAQDRCRTIRAMTNADGRAFADLAFSISRNPYRMSVKAGRGEALPTPENCDLSADADDVSMACYWRTGDFAATAAFYESLFNRLQQCLGGRLALPTGPSPYGDATALRDSSTDFEVAGGETRVQLTLIESPGTSGVPVYHYVSLSVTHDSPASGPAVPEDEDD